MGPFQSSLRSGGYRARGRICIGRKYPRMYDDVGGDSRCTLQFGGVAWRSGGASMIFELVRVHQATSGKMLVDVMSVQLTQLMLEVSEAWRHARCHHRHTWPKETPTPHCSLR